MKAPAEMVADAAERHGVERGPGHRESFRVALHAFHEKPLQRKVRRELRRAPEAAEPAVERAPQRQRQVRKRLGRKIDCLAAGSHLR